MEYTKRRKISGFMSLPTSILFTVIGLALLIFAVIYVSNNKIPSNYVQVDANIMAIIDTSTLPDEELYVVDIVYSYNGNIYNERFDQFDSSMQVGGTVKIYVNPDAPSE